jgi:hypothetical protein
MVKIEERVISKEAFEIPKSRLEIKNEFVYACPNDNTILKPNGGISRSSEGKYTEIATCPKCGYVVFRKPSDEAIARTEYHRKHNIFGLSFA